MLTLRTLPLAQLRPAPYNPRVPLKPGSPAFERLARSLREFSLVQPVVWNEQTGHIVSGHQRVEVLRHQGAQTVEVAVVSLSLEREKALNVTLNNAQVGSTWDADKLIDLVAELDRLPDFDATLTGFDEADIRDLLLAPAPFEPSTESADNDGLRRVTIDIPEHLWETVRPELDHLIARYHLTAHVAR